MDEQRAWIRSRRRKRLRVVAVALCVCLLITARPDILAALSTLASEWKDSTVYVSGFGELPEAVREQTVPLGTGVGGLSLPDTLEAFAETPEEEDKPGDADKPGDGNGETGDPDDGGDGTEKPGDESGETGNPDGGEDGTENPGDGSGETGNPGGGEGGTENPGDGNGETGKPGDGEGGTENPGDGSGETGNPGGGEGGTENPGDGTGDGTGDGNDGGSGDAGNADEGNSGEGEPETQDDSAPADDEGGAEDVDEMAKGADGALTVRRGVFVMPVYLSEPVDAAEPQTMERKEESVMIKGVTWQSEPAYDGSVEGTYVFTAVLPEGYALVDGVSLPQITVTVQGTDPVVQELLARIAALPEAEAYLADEPDMEAEDEYEAWMDGLSTYTAEALELWEMYETFTEEQRAQIPTEALVKLAAWVELAGQLAEGSMVMAAAETGEPFGDGLTWKLEGNTLTISGSGAMPDWAVNNYAPWYGDRGSIKNVTIGDNVTSIGDYAFDSCGSLTSITIPRSIKKIGVAAFDACLGLSSVTISQDVTDMSIGDAAFRSCYALTSINIPAGVTSIGHNGFYNGKLSEVKFEGMTTIPTLGTNCFYGCPCVAEGTKGLDIPSCSYLTGTGWSQYKNNVTKQHMLTHTDNVTERYWKCSVCQTQYSETISAENCDVTTEVAGESYTVTFTPNSGYNVPAEVTVTIGGTALGSADYTYTTSSTAGTLTIPRDKITGHVTITAEAEVKQVTIEVTLKKDGSLWSGQTVGLKAENGKHTYQAEERADNNGTYCSTVVGDGYYRVYVNGNAVPASFQTTGDTVSSQIELTYQYVSVTYDADGATGEVPGKEDCFCGSAGDGVGRNYVVKTSRPMTKPGYVQSGWSESSSGEAVERIPVKNGSGWVRTNPITLYPVFAPAKVTIHAENCTHNGADEVAATGDYTVTFTPETGYDVPAGVTVEIGGTALGSGDYTYEKSSTTGKLTISRNQITGNVTITATAAQHSHSLTYTADDTADTITESCSNGCGHTATATFDGSETKTYTGSEIKPFVVRYSPNADAWLGKERPAISYSSNTNAGTATAFLSVGTTRVQKTFTIAPKSLEDTTVAVTLPSDSYPYTGKAIEPAVTVSDSAIGGGVTLVAGTDYTVTYQNNTAVSTDASRAQAIIRGKGNYSGERRAEFTIQDSNPPDVSESDLEIDYSEGTIKLPPEIKDQVEVYTDPNDPEGSKLTLKADGSLPDDVEPGTTIYIRYPGSDNPTEVKIPPRPAAPAPVDKEKVEKTDTTIKVPKPDDGAVYEYVLVEKGEAPDWSQSNTTGEFTGLDPNQEYDLYMREQATEDSFASEPVKTEIRTTVTVKEPETGGAGAGKDGNDVSGGKPSADGGSVTYTGTCEEGSTPVIIVDGEEAIPEIT